MQDKKVQLEVRLTSASMVSNNLDIADESKIRIVVEDANAGNTVIIRGKILGQTSYDVLKTITGSGSTVVSVLTYDLLQIECTIYDSSSNNVKVAISSFNDAGGSAIETIGVVSGNNLTDVSEFSFISSDSTIDIIGNNTTKEIDLKISATSLSGYQRTFNNSGDWGSPASGFYSIIVLASTHGQGSKPLVQTYEGTEQVDIFTDVNVSGDVLIKVSQIPDQRFSGKIHIK